MLVCNTMVTDIEQVLQLPDMDMENMALKMVVAEKSKDDKISSVHDKNSQY